MSVATARAASWQPLQTRSVVGVKVDPRFRDFRTLLYCTTEGLRRLCIELILVPTKGGSATIDFDQLPAAIPRERLGLSELSTSLCVSAHERSAVSFIIHPHEQQYGAVCAFEGDGG